MSQEHPDGGGRVSCIVAAHASRQWIGDAIESILAQTHPPFELIAVCSGDDGTADVAREYSDPVRVMEIENVSPPHNRNTGAAAATGDFLAFLDADDAWHPEKLERQLALLSERPELRQLLG